MEWHIFPHEDGSGDWTVEAINLPGEGEIFTTIFSGCDTEERAKEYYELKTMQQENAA